MLNDLTSQVTPHLTAMESHLADQKLNDKLQRLRNQRTTRLRASRPVRPSIAPPLLLLRKKNLSLVAEVGELETEIEGKKRFAGGLSSELRVKRFVVAVRRDWVMFNGIRKGELGRMIKREKEKVEGLRREIDEVGILM
ncbi:hypothetical protein K470DRAFT_259736 [Piedraia hortae CBS 480.64]|uniref:Uncharacterized protein n=1 Tax=Piedraia hortae CBS 480.64 TaxID=1314780 RepID=A0A6A7BTA9_9PEZI|nr:hypothetical protein K470DRAFT_259736 [Piedraia hortae CBS 480.64]